MPCERCGYEPWPRQHVWRLRLPIRAVSQNQLGGYGRGRAGWKYRNTKRAYSSVLRTVLQSRYGTRVPPASAYRRLVVTRVFGKGSRAFDVGNLIGGFKPLVDALTGNRIIVDDSPKFVQIWYDQYRSEDGQHYVDITIEEKIEETNTK